MQERIEVKLFVRYFLFVSFCSLLIRFYSHRIDVDSMSILLRYIERKISTNFRAISTYFFGERKINIVSTYFLPRNFGGQKIDFVSTYLLDVISIGQKATSFRCTFLIQFLWIENWHICGMLVLMCFWKSGARFDIFFW